MNTSNSYREIFEQFSDNASFLWVLRSIALNQPHYTQHDIFELEQRIQAQLDGLMVSIDVAWDLCLQAFELAEPGEIFTAAVIAFSNQDPVKIQTVVEIGLSNPDSAKGLISALGWLPSGLIRPWIKKFLMSKDLNHKYLAVAAASVRREDQGEYLVRILNREDCQENIALYARTLRLVGEMRRTDLMSYLLAAQASDHPDVQYWSAWSAIILGHKPMVNVLKSFVFKSGKHQNSAVELAFRILPVETARAWISTLAEEEGQARIVIKATGILGDPYALNWLIAKMSDSRFSRLAAEAFTQITGIDLIHNDLIADPQIDKVIDEDLELDEDDNLPWPDVVKVTDLWQKQCQHLQSGQRYILGKPVSIGWLLQTLETGTMRQRHAAALELSLLNESPILNTRTRSKRPVDGAL